ncbi:hypothetical protein TNCV_168801 [Trichonephila clavipes]|nr:hypothetical protein TNCV_168801 [Trichonephila clavipes]
MRAVMHVSQLTVIDEYNRHEEVAGLCVTTSILVMTQNDVSKTSMFVTRLYDEYTRHGVAEFCVMTCILVMERLQYFVSRRVYSS